MGNYQDQINFLESTINQTNSAMKLAEMQLKNLKKQAESPIYQSKYGVMFLKAARKVFQPVLNASNTVDLMLNNPVEYRVREFKKSAEKILESSSETVEVTNKFWHKFQLVNMAKLALEGQYLMSEHPEKMDADLAIRLSAEMIRLSTLPQAVKVDRSEKLAAKPIVA